jgi:hypothetical protein
VSPPDREDEVSVMTASARARHAASARSIAFVAASIDCGVRSDAAQPSAFIAGGATTATNDAAKTASMVFLQRQRAAQTGV